jgi:taurine dioxygenase
MDDTLVKKLAQTFVAEIDGIDLSHPPSDQTLHDLSHALMEHKVLVLRDQDLTTEQYARFGRSWSDSLRVDSFSEMHVLGFADMNMVGNYGELFKDDGYRNGAAFWHTDCAAEPDPNATTMLYSIYTPVGLGLTVFADMEAAYEALDAKTQSEISELVVEHCYAGAMPILGGREDWEHELTPTTDQTKLNLPDPVERPLVRSHSVTNRKAMYAPAGSGFNIPGMDFDSASTLMRKLKLFATDKRFCYQHKYQPGDLVMWDNSSTMHYAQPICAATGEHDRRLLYRMCPLGLPKHL